jgi:hypothetical protein
LAARSHAWTPTLPEGLEEDEREHNAPTMLLVTPA